LHSLAVCIYPSIIDLTACRELSSRGLDLENVVYYQVTPLLPPPPYTSLIVQGNTHYFVMTPKRQALLAYGVLRRDLAPPEDLSRDNIDGDKLKQFARSVSEAFGLPPSCPFVTDSECFYFHELHYL
jgi:hypothetical protein